MKVRLNSPAYHCTWFNKVGDKSADVNFAKIKLTKYIPYGMSRKSAKLKNSIRICNKVVPKSHQGKYALLIEAPFAGSLELIFLDG